MEAGKRCAVGLAIEMIEAWLLADETALRAALGDPQIMRQPDPERLGAGDEASDNHPKGRLLRLIERCIEEPDFPAVYAAIAAAAQLENIEQRCEGFAAFADQVRSLVV